MAKGMKERILAAALEVFSQKGCYGTIIREFAAMLACACTAPISALIHLCNRHPEGTEEAIRQAEAFSRHFIKTYAV